MFERNLAVGPSPFVQGTNAAAHRGAGSLTLAQQLINEAEIAIVAAGQSAGVDPVGASTYGAHLGSTADTVEASNPTYLPHTGDNYWHFTGTTGNYISVPDNAAFDITGDIDIRARFVRTSSGSLSGALVGREQFFGDRSYRLNLVSNELQLYYSTDGSTSSNFASTAGGTSPTLTEGVPIYLRGTIDVDDGSGNRVARYYESTDGESWTLLHTVTVAGTISLHAGASNVAIGARINGANDAITGGIYEAEIRNGIDGAVVARFDAGDAPLTGAAWTGSTDSLTWTPTYSANGTSACLIDAPAWYCSTSQWLRIPDVTTFPADTSDVFTIVQVGRWMYPGSDFRTLFAFGWTPSVYMDLSGSEATTLRVSDGVTTPSTSDRASPMVTGQKYLVAALIKGRGTSGADQGAALYTSMSGMEPNQMNLTGVGDLTPDTHAEINSRNNGASACNQAIEGKLVFTRVLSVEELDALVGHFGMTPVTHP